MGGHHSKSGKPRLTRPGVITRDVAAPVPYTDLFLGRAGIWGIGAPRLVQLAVELRVAAAVVGIRQRVLRITPQALNTSREESIAVMDRAVERIVSLATEVDNQRHHHRHHHHHHHHHIGQMAHDLHSPRTLVMIDFTSPIFHGRHLGAMIDGQVPVVDVRALARVVEGYPRLHPRRRVCLVRSQGDRLCRVWHRLHYHTVAKAEQPAVQARQQLQEFLTRASRHRGRPSVVIVSADGALEGDNPEDQRLFSNMLSEALGRGVQLEVWSWRDSRLPLYQALASQYPSALTFRDLDDYQVQFLYATPQSTPPPPPISATSVLPTAIPVAVGELVEGDVVTNLKGLTLDKVGKVQADTKPPPVPQEAAEKTGATVGEVLEEKGSTTTGGGAADTGSSSDSDGSDTEEGGSQARPLEEVVGEAREGGGGAGGDVDADDIPAPFVDPITFDLMTDPVTTPSGISYERSVILEEIRLRGLCPFSQQPITEADLRPNRALKDLIELYLMEKDKKKQQEEEQGKPEAKK